MPYTLSYPDDAGSDPGLLAALGLAEPQPFQPAPAPAGAGGGVAGDLRDTQPHASRNPLQGGADWLAERCGCLTASKAHLIFDRLKAKKGQEIGDRSAEAQKYMMELVAERMTGNSVQHYVNRAMQHGIDTEAEARAVYASLTGTTVTLVGFRLHNTIPFFGASPDGDVDGLHLVEIKCPETTTFLRWKAAGVVPEEHKPQMLAQCACTGSPWVDFFAYDNRIKNPAARHLLLRYEPSPDDLARCEAEAAAFLAEVDALFVAVTTA